MKKDIYLKIILTIIALCLLWICIRDIKIGEQNLYASSQWSSYDTLNVRLVDVDSKYRSGIPVKIQNEPILVMASPAIIRHLTD